MVVAQVVMVVLPEGVDLHTGLCLEPLLFAEQIVNDHAHREAPLGVVRDPHDTGLLDEQPQAVVQPRHVGGA